MLTVLAKGTKTCPAEAMETLLIPRSKTISINFNPDYLIEALAAVSDDEVLIPYGQSGRTCPSASICYGSEELPVAVRAGSIGGDELEANARVCHRLR